MPVSGARTVAANSAPIPATAKMAGLATRPGKNLGRLAIAGAKKLRQRQHGRKNFSRHSASVAHDRRQQPRGKNAHQQLPCRISRQQQEITL
jgi:hypothetical protein